MTFSKISKTQKLPPKCPKPKNYPKITQKTPIQKLHNVM